MQAMQGSTWRGHAICVIVAAVAFGGTVAVADTVHVPGDYPTIQAGVDAALPGDEVVVADGTWTGEGNRDIDFLGKAITVRSASGDPTTCIIDCESQGRGFFFGNGETADSVLDGFTIQIGLATATLPGGNLGGGIYSISQPTIRNCVVTLCKTDDGASGGSGADGGNGGGVYFGTPATITDCTIRRNATGRGGDSSSGGFGGDGGDGGGIYSASSITIVNCDVVNNGTGAGGLGEFGGDGGDGGGVYCGARAMMMACEIVGNSAGPGETEGGAGGRGGGIAAQSVELTDCAVAGNQAGSGASGFHAGGDGGDGGGIYCGPSSSVVGCEILSNVAGDGALCSGGNLCQGWGGNGGGVFLRGPALIDGCSITGNNVGFAAVICDPGNVEHGDGGGVHAWPSGGAVAISNSLLCRNSANQQITGPWQDDGGNTITWICCAGDADASGTVDFGDVLEVLEHWGPCPSSGCGPSGHGTSDNGVVTARPYVGAGWINHGFSGLTAYRVYAAIDGWNKVLAAFGEAPSPLRVSSSDGQFHNDELGGLTAPLDLTSVGIWSNQWDTYVTINATAAQGDVTGLSPGFAEATNSLTTSFEDDNVGWFVRPEDEQGHGPRVLLGQFVVAEGESIDGVLNLFLGDDSTHRDLEFESSRPLSACTDLNGDGAVDFGDLLVVLSSWGPCE